MDAIEMGQDESCAKEDKSINIDISLIMDKMGGKPHHGGPGGPGMDHSDKPGGGPDKGMCLNDLMVCDDDLDWKSIAKQLIQAVSMMDTHTDGVEAGTEDPEGALKAIDNETSRILWGKQEEDNPMSSYQNANYGKTTANGMVMTNPAVQFNCDAYGSEFDPDIDGDVDFHNPEVVKKVDKAEGFKEAANNVIQKGGGGRNEKKRGKQEGSGSDSGFGKQEREPGSESKESESEESEVS